MKKLMTTFVGMAVGLLFASTAMATAPPAGQHLQSSDKPFETMDLDGTGALTGICLKDVSCAMTSPLSIDAIVVVAEIGIHRPKNLDTIHDDSANAELIRIVNLETKTTSPPTDRPLEVTDRTAFVAATGFVEEANASALRNLKETAVGSGDGAQYIPFTG